jgi:Uma2 family endonuclease
MTATLDAVPLRLLDPEDLLSMPNGDFYELIDGIPVKKAMGGRTSKVNVKLLTMLETYVDMHQLGHVFDSDGSYACFTDRPRMVRKPDTSFVGNVRLPGEEAPPGNITIVPDLVVEVVSPKNTHVEIEEKIQLFRNAGTRLIWVIIPETTRACIHRRDGTVTEIGPDGLLDGEDVIPGFRCPIARLFKK